MRAPRALDPLRGAQDPEDAMRGPMLQLGHRYKGANLQVGLNTRTVLVFRSMVLELWLYM